MRTFVVLCVAGLLSLPPISAWAAVEIHEWYGRYEMNYDGRDGTLIIDGSGESCVTPVWCSMVLRYIDSKGRGHRVRMERLDDNLQHIVFFIDFRGRPQQFEGYLFTWDKTKIAGTTNVGRRTSGFFAVKKGESRAATVEPRSEALFGANLDRRIIPDGAVETRYPDGTITQRSRSGTVTILPDGRRQQTLFQEVQPATPPIPPPGSDIAKWLTAHGERLLDIIVALASNDPNAKHNYLQSEAAVGSVYEKLHNRTTTIQYLVSP